MVICDICTGRHLTSCCVIAEPFVAQCFEGTVGDYEPEPLPGNVIQLRTIPGRAMVHHRRQARDHQGIEVTRIA